MLSNIWQFNDFKKNINFLKQNRKKRNNCFRNSLSNYPVIQSPAAVVFYGIRG